MTTKRAERTRGASVAAYVIAYLMLLCAFSTMSAQNAGKGGKDTKAQSGETPPPADAPAPPKGTPKAAATTDDSKPAERDWKLANVPVRLWEGDAPVLHADRSPFVHWDEIAKVVQALAAFATNNPLKAAMTGDNRKECTDVTIPWIVQAAVLSNDLPDPATPAVETYLYWAKQPPKKQEDLEKTRIYGQQKACFALLVYGEVAARIKGTERVAVSSQEEIAGSDRPSFKELSAGRLAGGGVWVRSTDLSVGQFYAAKKKTPAPLQDLIALLGLGKALAQVAPTPEPVPTLRRWLVGTNQIENLPVPSDMWVQAGKPGSALRPTAFSAFAPEVQFDNEGKYWYDFSVTFPVNNINAIEYNQGDNNVQTREVDLKTVYATANVFLWPADIKDPSTLWAPRLLFGIGLRGKPFDRMFIGAGFGLNKFIKWAPLAAVQPFAGLSFNRVYEKLGAGADAVLKGREIHKLVIGINVPVKSVVDRLKSK
jgi:hypothetical protein